MRSAPSVIYPVGRCALQGGAVVLLGVLGATCLYVAWPNLPGAMWWAVLVAWLTWCAIAGKGCLKAAAGWLQWSGAASASATGGNSGWSWKPDLYGDGWPVHEVEAVLDLQLYILLRLSGPAAAPSWVWVERSRAPHAWLALRRAVTGDGTG